MPVQESSSLSPDLLLTLNLFFLQVSSNSSLVSQTFLIKKSISIFDPTANRNEQCILKTCTGITQ